MAFWSRFCCKMGICELDLEDLLTVMNDTVNVRVYVPHLTEYI